MNRGLNDEDNANELRLMKLIQMLMRRSDEKKFQLTLIKKNNRVNLATFPVLVSGCQRIRRMVSRYQRVVSVYYHPIFNKKQKTKRIIQHIVVRTCVRSISRELIWMEPMNLNERHSHQTGRRADNDKR